jgi:choline dehydrogenase-like flavoprotein
MLPEGHGLPGGETAGVGRRLSERMESFDPKIRARMGWLVRIWDLSPLLTRNLRTFARLPEDKRSAYVEAAYHSKITAKRNLTTALKQLCYMQWGSTPEAEDALGYDYRCAADDVPRGAGREVDDKPSVAKVPEEPADYFRRGPAIDSGAIPLHLLDRRGFEHAPDPKLETRCWPDLSDGARERCDVVVIGSGAGGATVAATLAEAGADVIVLEEGSQVTTDDFRGPPFDRFQRYCRDNATTLTLGTPPIPLPLGRVVGGTTVVNSGTCFRAPAKVLDRWRTEYGIEHSSAHDLAPHYEAIESFLNVRPVPWELLGPNGRLAHDGAVALGLSGGPLLRNITDCHGCGQCAFGCPTGAKQAMHVSYLPRAQRAGARIYSRCRVDRILLDGDRVTGVKASLRDEAGRRQGEITVEAGHVVVCAGAIHTPALLATSGVPDPSGQTGRNLRIHPATGVAAVFEQEVFNWKGTLQSYYIDSLFDTHEVMLEATTTVPSVGAGSVSGIGAAAMERLAKFPRLATLGLYVSDTSKGRVRKLRTGDLLITYKLNRLDSTRICAGLAVAAEVLLEAGAKTAHLGLPGYDEVSSRADLERLREGRIPRSHLKLTAFHPMGTARMGADPGRSVVAPDGRHHAVSNLWIADASTFPSCVGVNPQLTIMAFAKHTAEIIGGGG